MQQRSRRRQKKVFFDDDDDEDYVSISVLGVVAVDGKKIFSSLFLFMTRFTFCPLGARKIHCVLSA